MDPPAGADLALGSAAQKAAGEAQAQSMSTRGFINPGSDGNTPDSTNTAPVAGLHIRPVGTGHLHWPSRVLSLWQHQNTLIDTPAPRAVQGVGTSVQRIFRQALCLCIRKVQATGAKAALNMHCNSFSTESRMVSCNSIMWKACCSRTAGAEGANCATEDVDPDGAFSKEAQTAAAEKQASGMGTGGSIKVRTSLPRRLCNLDFFG